MPQQAIRISNGQPAALHERSGRSASIVRFAGSREPTSLWLTTEQKLIRAYLALQAADADDDGFRTAPFARYGDYEVRLVEPPEDVMLDTFPVWIELYSHAAGVTLDSCGRDKLDGAVAAADDFIERAKALHLEGADPVGLPRRALSARIVRALREAGFDSTLTGPVGASIA